MQALIFWARGGGNVVNMTAAERRAAGAAIRAEARRELARRDYTAYCRYVHRNKWEPGPHHLLISDKLQAVMRGEIKRLMVWMPPRHGKSMQITETLPSYYLGKRPDDQVICVSYGVDLAERFGRANRQKVSEYGQQMWGISLSRSSSSATSWGIEGHTGGMRSVGIGGGITGQGADLLIIDDPVKNREEAESKTTQDKIAAEYQSTLYTRLHPGAAIIIVMTRWHEDDLCGRLLAQQEDGDTWEVLSLPAIAESADDALGREIGTPLWPEHGFDRDWAEATRRSVGAYTWASLYQQRPAPAEGGLIKRAWWRYYDDLPDMMDKIISVDAAFKGNEENDFVSIQTWGKRDADMYLIDKDKRHMDFPATVQAIRDMYAKHPDTSCILIEDKANGPAIISMLQRDIPGVVPVNPQGGKVARANAVSPAIEAGNVWLPRTAWADDLVEEAAVFPNGKHDDDVDAMTQALNRFIYHRADVPHITPKVKWHDDQYEDYYNCETEAQRALLIERWGDPFGS